MRRHYRGRPVAWGPLVLVAALLLGFLGLDISIKPYMNTVAAYEAKNYAVQTVYAAVQNELAAKSVSYEHLVNITRSSDGAVQSISSDVEAQNTLQTQLTQTVQKAIRSQSHTTVWIPAGTLTGSSLLHGRGPGLPLKITLSGAVQTQLKSTFDSAGVNQTRHRLFLQVTVSLYTYMIGKDVSQQVAVEVPVAETVIVGEVPSIALSKYTGQTTS
ncbi:MULTISPECIES: sporulation protein YunB [Caproicibacterium]|uniref:Sporulation protein YunB n=1 Tax=Caproicibacterium argilliputei TaxID=3030016 RepID=A0AA97H4I6_9FIRM|nr:sporulation protein YunB [Caproicibacterium argilliputei]WOC33528.1 sporulation protein YunB [Caproicibacterium argilliputei]